MRNMRRRMPPKRHNPKPLHRRTNHGTNPLSTRNRSRSKILAFLCNWCSYAGADLAGTSRFEYPANVRVIRVMCSGRVSNDFIFEAFRLGAGTVMIGACHLPYDCHYINGNARMKERTDALRPMLQKIGLSPQRLRVEYVQPPKATRYGRNLKNRHRHENTSRAKSAKKT